MPIIRNSKADIKGKQIHSLDGTTDIEDSSQSLWPSQLWGDDEDSLSDIYNSALRKVCQDMGTRRGYLAGGGYSWNAPIGISGTIGEFNVFCGNIESFAFASESYVTCIGQMWLATQAYPNSSGAQNTGVNTSDQRAYFSGGYYFAQATRVTTFLYASDNDVADAIDCEDVGYNKPNTSSPYGINLNTPSHGYIGGYNQLCRFQYSSGGAQASIVPGSFYAFDTDDPASGGGEMGNYGYYGYGATGSLVGYYGAWESNLTGRGYYGGGAERKSSCGWVDGSYVCLFEQSISSMSFANDTVWSETGDMSIDRSKAATCSSATHAYHIGGLSASVTANYLDDYEKFQFVNGNSIGIIGNITGLVNGKQYNGAAWSTPSYGYQIGGTAQSNGNVGNDIGYPSKISYVTDSDSVLLDNAEALMDPDDYWYRSSAVTTST